MNTVKIALLATGCFYECEALQEYCKLIANNRLSTQQKFKTQQHHIVPRCYYEYNNLVCNDSAENLVHLQFKDHLVAHYLLFHCCNDGNLRHGLASAFLLLKCTTCKDITLSDVDLDAIQLLFEEYLKTRSIRYKGRKGYNKGRKIINNGIQEKLVYPEVLQDYVSNGWKMGRLPFSEEDKKKKSVSHIGRKVMSKGDLTVHVKPSEVDDYLTNGYIFGYSAATLAQRKKTLVENPPVKVPHTVVFNGEEYRTIRLEELDYYQSEGYIQKGRPLSIQHKDAIGSKNKQNHTGRIHVHKDTEHYMIKSSELEEYLMRGFSTGSGVSTAQPPSVWMHKDGKNARVHPDKEQQYLENGWSRGMLKGDKLKR